MTILVLGSLLFGALVGLAVQIFATIRRTRRQIDAERRVAELVATNDLLRQRLFAFYEAMDRYGDRAGQRRAHELAEAILHQLNEMDVGDRYVIEALVQPSLIGRVRYVEKLAAGATREIEEHGELALH